MTSPDPASAPITCEILAGRAEVSALTKIVAQCAEDAGQPVSVTTQARQRAAKSRGSRSESVMTLVLPATLAASQHQVWCLACQLACFCPDTRVSVLVRGESAFAPERKPQRRNRSAA